LVSDSRSTRCKALGAPRGGRVSAEDGGGRRFAAGPVLRTGAPPCRVAARGPRASASPLAIARVARLSSLATWSFKTAFNLHAKTTRCPPTKTPSPPLRYVLRRLSAGRLTVCLTTGPADLKRPGQMHLRVDMVRSRCGPLGQCVAPEAHQTIYSGVLAARPIGSLISARARDPSASAAQRHRRRTEAPQLHRRSPGRQAPPSGSRCRYIGWSELLRLTFGLTSTSACMRRAP